MVAVSPWVRVRPVKVLSLSAVDKPASDKVCAPVVEPVTDKVAVSPEIEPVAQSLTTTKVLVAGVLVKVQVVVPAGRASVTPPAVILTELSQA